MVSRRPQTVLVVNNNPHQAPGVYTQLVIQHLKDEGLPVWEARTVEAVDACARDVESSGGDVGLIVSCGSPVVLTEPVDVEAHVTKTTAALLHFPNAPVVGICFGMQLLTVLYGGSLVAQKDTGHAGGHWERLSRLEPATRLMDGFPGHLVQWASNFIFVEQLPPRFIPTAVDSRGRCMAMEHSHEHVYGVQFHPEKLYDGDGSIGRLLIGRIVALVGQNRRIKRGDVPAGGTWRCSAQCPLRQALRDVMQGNIGGPGFAAGCPSCLGRPGNSLGGRLAAAKREALETLRRDHCHQGGISPAALEEAIGSLSQIAGAAGADEVAGARGRSKEPAGGAMRAGGPSDEDGCLPAGGQEAGWRSAHAADLHMRAAVKDALQKRGFEAGNSSSSRTTSMGSAHTSATCSIVCAPTRAELGARLPTQDISAGAFLSMHDVDLRLRQVVSDEMALASPRPGLGARVAGAKRETLALLRREGQRRADGAVPGAALKVAIARLQGIARGA